MENSVSFDPCSRLVNGKKPNGSDRKEIEACPIYSGLFLIRGLITFLPQLGIGDLKIHSRYDSNITRNKDVQEAGPIAERLNWAILETIS